MDMPHTPEPEVTRTREELLRVLLDTATDITALRDTDAALPSVS